MSSIIVKRATYREFNLTFTYNDGVTPIDLTGVELKFSVKSKSDKLQNDNKALIEKTITAHTDAENGLSQLILSTTDTDISAGSYKWDIRMQITETDRNNTNTGDFIVEEKVTYE